MTSFGRQLASAATVLAVQGPSAVARRLDRRRRLARLHGLSPGDAFSRWRPRFEVPRVADPAAPSCRLLCAPGAALRPGVVTFLEEQFRRFPETQILFGDDLIADAAGRPFAARLRPAWSPEADLDLDALGGVVAVRREADADLWAVPPSHASRGRLRADVRRPTVTHVPRLLTLVPEAPESGADEEVRRSEFPGEMPSLTVVIPTRDGGEVLRRCLDSLGRADYSGRITRAVVDNGPGDGADLTDLPKDVLVHRDSRPFHFSRMMNEAAERSRDEYVLFLNDDTELLSRAGLSHLVAHARGEDVAVVGAQLRYPDGTVQHCGVVPGMGIVAGHLYRGERMDAERNFASPARTREVGAVDGAAFLVRREFFREQGGFDAKGLPISFSDVDFCLRAQDAGRRIVYCAEAVFLHHETKTRSPILDPREIARMESRWSDRLGHDPFYHPGLTLLDESGALDAYGDRA